LWPAYLNRANANYHLEDPAASNDYVQAFRLNPEGAAKALVRLLAEQLHDDAGAAFADCEKHLRANPRHTMSYARRGILLMLQGNFAEGQRDIDLANRLNPENKPLRDLMIRAIQNRHATPA